ncbi:MAG: hypothetical protein KIH44_000440 [Octadecabacter sp.]|nr:hypothetical protein [Octadecabacter sp.]
MKPKEENIILDVAFDLVKLAQNSGVTNLGEDLLSVVINHDERDSKQDAYLEMARMLTNHEIEARLFNGKVYYISSADREQP